MYADHAACGPIPGCRKGMAGACNESPIMASLAMQHMLLQSWNGKPIAIFPSMPEAWAEARFANMRAEGVSMLATATCLLCLPTTPAQPPLAAGNDCQASLISPQAVLVSAVRANATTLWFALNATKGGNLTVHTVILDLIVGKSSTTLQIDARQTAPGVYDITPPDTLTPWTAVFHSRARGAPSAQEMVISPLPAGPLHIWGSRKQTPLPPPPPPPPLPPCPPTGCAGCAGCHWPYENCTEPDPSRPFMKQLFKVTTLQCEAQCGAAASCVGFTQRGASCWLYAQVSGRFAHRPGSSVSWHPKHALGAGNAGQHTD
jgi:hypothetical protein